MISLYKDFEAITITGYYVRDIRFPVSHLLEGVDIANASNRLLYRMRDLMP